MTAIDPEYPAHADSTERYNYDYGAAHFSTPFAALSTYMAVESDLKPSEVHIAGYPYEVQGEEGSLAMWYSYGEVTEVDPRVLYHVADISSGNSGGPTWELDDDNVRRIVGVLTAGGPEINATTRFVTDNLDYITLWMMRFPEGEVDLWEPDDTAETAESFDGRCSAGAQHRARNRRGLVLLLTGRDFGRYHPTRAGRAGSGADGDTRMWLYDEQLNELAFDDDSGDNGFSRIDRTCGENPLPAGTYYLLVDFSRTRRRSACTRCFSTSTTRVP